MLFFQSFFHIVLLTGTHWVLLNSDFFFNPVLSYHTLIIQTEKLDILTVDTAFCFPANNGGLKRKNILSEYICSVFSFPFSSYSWETAMRITNNF